MQPTYKAASVDSIISEITGKNRMSTIENGLCVFCDATGLTEASFRDTLSVREYEISGMCQECQDTAFQPYDEEE